MTERTPQRCANLGSGRISATYLGLPCIALFNTFRFGRGQWCYRYFMIDLGRRAFRDVKLRPRDGLSKILLPIDSLKTALDRREAGRSDHSQVAQPAQGTNRLLHCLGTDTGTDGINSLLCPSTRGIEICKLKVP